MQKPIIAANWKMHKTIEEAVDFARELKAEASTFTDRTVIIAPPFTALRPVADILRGSTVQLAAQTMAYAESGAFTGEISAAMIADAGCSYVLIGHSERRNLFGETDGQVNKKVKLALKTGLIPVVCVGETLEQRESGRTLSTVEGQIKEGLRNVSADDIRKIIVAYEPVWAIGTGKTATPEQAVEVHIFIKEILSGYAGIGDGRTVPVIYGGSVNEGTIDELMAHEGINGVLVGGASLKPASFMNIVRFRSSATV
ncbi:MAG: triose-phosphate isomerase [Syntrophales bacterium]|jgi:triosephosphate isomerase|nr:triose-phosphate isomerase [Syntrophales bacterium]MCK9528355.1 triose-phosphate isomerase [Syntrophales bacterium]MDX9922720.1 triose-phosphate isomerase [Syntrophales bacterium]